MSLKPFHAEGSYIAVRATDIDSGNILSKELMFNVNALY